MLLFLLLFYDSWPNTLAVRKLSHTMLVIHLSVIYAAHGRTGLAHPLSPVREHLVLLIYCSFATSIPLNLLVALDNAVRAHRLQIPDALFHGRDYTQRLPAAVVGTRRAGVAYLARV